MVTNIPLEIVSQISSFNCINKSAAEKLARKGWILELCPVDNYGEIDLDLLEVTKNRFVQGII